MIPSIVESSFLFLNFLQFRRKDVQLLINLSTASQMPLQISFSFGDTFLNLIESAHHKVEIVIYFLLLLIDLSPDHLRVRRG